MSLIFKGPEIHEDFVDYIMLNEIAHKIGNVYRSHDDPTWSLCQTNYTLMYFL